MTDSGNQMDWQDVLYVGKIYVEITEDFSLGEIVAETDAAILGAPQLGFELRTQVSVLDYEDDEDPDLEAMLRQVLDGMRLALARCFIWGKMVLTPDDLSEAAQQGFNKALAGLPEEYLRITPALSLKACVGQAERDARFTVGLKLLGNLMQEEGLRRGLNKEERTQMSIGDMMGKEKEENRSTKLRRTKQKRTRSR